MTNVKRRRLEFAEFKQDIESRSAEKRAWKSLFSSSARELQMTHGVSPKFFAAIRELFSANIYGLIMILKSAKSIIKCAFASVRRQDWRARFKRSSTSKSENQYDMRNAEAVLTAKKIVEALGEYGKYHPFIVK